MIATQTIPEQLTDIYFKEEWWHTERMDYQSAVLYHTKRLTSGNIIYYEENGIVLGYVEFWRINFEQFGRIICHIPFIPSNEDITSGNIAIVRNVWVNAQRRHSNIIKWLKLMFFKATFQCDYFVGEALRKKTQPVKVFKKSALVSRLFREGEI